jgi:hypothetical protein
MGSEWILGRMAVGVDWIRLVQDRGRWRAVVNAVMNVRILAPRSYSPQITSWSPKGTRVLRQCKVLLAGVMFVTIQSENIRPSKKEMNKAVTILTIKIHTAQCLQLGYESLRLLIANQ